MKKIVLFLSLCIAFLEYSNAQVFWFENWTGGFGAQGTTTYAGPNGSWSTVSTGTNGAAANVWYFSFTESEVGRGSCGVSSGTHATAHIGNVSNSPNAHIYCPAGDCKAWADIGPGSPSDRTNVTLESPVIDCTNKTSIILSFNYIMSQRVTTVEYYDGTTWTPLPDPTSTIVSPCFSNGLWTYYSTVLPASADNNANVQIGFKWTNDTTSYDTISFAIDSISLSGSPINGITKLDDYNNYKVYPNPNNGIFTIQSSEIGDKLLIEVYNLVGEKVFTGNLNPTQSGNSIDLSMQPEGVYLYKIYSPDENLMGIGKLIIQK